MQSRSPANARSHARCHPASVMNGLHCTQACFLEECQNMKDEQVVLAQEDGLESDSDSDI